MVGDRFLYCRRCGDVHRITRFDQAPVYRRDRDGVTEIPADDQRAFLDRHAKHGIEELTAVSETRVQNYRINDPTAVRSVEVSNGETLFTLRTLRRSIAEPLSYRVVPTQLTLWK